MYCTYTYIAIYTHMHVTTVKRKGSYLKDSHAWGKYRGLGGRKSRQKLFNHVKKKRKKAIEHFCFIRVDSN